MKCKNCGAELPRNSKFCPFCGVELAAKSRETEKTYTITNKDNQKIKTKHQRGVKHKRIAPVVIGFFILFTAVIAVAVLVSKNSDQRNAYIILSDGSFEVLSNLKTDKTIEIASAESDDSSNSMVSFSSDGKYVYYFTQYDSDTKTGTLCRAEYGKLKNNSGNNDNYIQVISSDVYISFTKLSDEKLLFLDGSNNLYYYNGEGTVRIAKSIVRYAVDDSENSERLIYMVEEGDYYTLYGVDLDDINQVITLASDVQSLYNYGDFDNIVYSKYDLETHRRVLYVVGFEKDSKIIGENIYSTMSITTSEMGTVYFTEESENAAILYDYVIDNYDEVDPNSSIAKLRNELQSEENAYSYKTLYCYENGELNVVLDNVFDVGMYSGCFIYNTPDVIEKVDIDEVTMAYQVSELFALDLAAENCLMVIESGDVYQIAKDAAEVLANALANGRFEVFVLNGDIFLNEYNGALYVAAISGNTIEEFVMISSEASIVDVNADALFYASDIYTSDSYTYFDLYSYCDGESTRLVQDISTSGFSLYEDGKLIGVTDHDGGTYEITEFAEDGTANYIIENVSQHIRVDTSTLIYLSGGDLYMRDNDETVLVKENVERVWSLEKASADASLNIWLHE